MSDGTPLFGGLHIDLTDSDPVLITVHPDGELSVCMTGEQGSLSFYLTGTPDELHWLCDKLRAIVTAHESQTTLAGEAAREVVTVPAPNRRCPGCSTESGPAFHYCAPCDFYTVSVDSPMFRSVRS